jgi:hypothetical protein
VSAPTDPAALSAGATAALLERTLIATALPGARTAAHFVRLAAVQAGERSAWPAAARALWADEGVRNECDRQPGLRARLCADGVGGVLEGLTDLLARRAAGGDGGLFGLQDGVLWIADPAFRELAYHLELNAWGCAPGFAAEPLLADLLAAPAGAAELWRRWLAWAGGGAPARGFVCHPALVGSLPASGLPAHAPRLGAVVAAVRAASTRAPLLAIGSRPALLPWTPRVLPTVDEWLRTTAAHAERAALRALATPGGLRRALARDPLAALTGWLALTGEAAPGAALVRGLLATLATLAPLAEPAPGEARAATIALPAPARLPPLRLARLRGRLLVEADGLAGLVTWLGLFPTAYRPAAGFWCWPFVTLAACGWSVLAEAGHWQLVGLAGGTALPAAPAGWIAFAVDDLTAASCAHLPDTDAELVPFYREPSCALSILAPWSGPE